MINAIKSRLFQGYRTGTFPRKNPVLPERFKGVLSLDASKCGGACDPKCCALDCAAVCPTDALRARPCADGEDERNGSSSALLLDGGKCIACGKCEEACPSHALRFLPEHRMASFSRENLLRDPAAPFVPDEYQDRAIRSLIGKSLKIRQVSAGGCNACECDFNVLSTLAWDMGRFGIQAVASPRHADALLVTGPVTRNMLLALRKTFDAMPQPRCVIACGACAISGGLYAGHTEECAGGVNEILPVDLFVPGCPPHPTVLLDALLRFMGKNF